MKNILCKSSILYFVPLFVFAAPSLNNFADLINFFTEIISSTIPIIVSLALLYFFWGLAQFVMNSGGGKEQEEAKNTMVWGVIALFVMVSIWGIVEVLKNTFIS